MDATGYTTLTRQAGLMREMDVIAQNIANLSTTGFRREGVVFSEYVQRLDDGPSLSMAHGNTRAIDLAQAGLTATGGSFDFAIQGEGFFLIETPEGQQLTRAGAFTPSAAGELVTMDGFRLLDEGGAPVVVPPGTSDLSMAEDGTLSSRGLPLSRIGLWQPADLTTLHHEAGTRFSADAVEPAGEAVLRQGYLEDSNVQPVSEIARMITVQRAYELGQTFLDREDARLRGIIETLGR